MSDRQVLEFLQKTWDSQDGACAISGVPLQLQKPATASLDRRDSAIGYADGNVQFVHKVVNIMKNKIPEDEFLNWIELIYTHRVHC